MKRSTATQNVHTLHTHFFIPQLNRYRSIYIYLPPDYHSSDKRYPVLYLQDGQNIFDEATAFSKEWKVDKTLNQLHKRKDYGAIVVGISNGGTHRNNEYAAWHRHRLGGGEAEIYLQFIVETLKPFVDTHFRTLWQAQHTALVGSSMGGLFALYGILKRGDIFGKAGVLSPSFWFNSQIYEFAEKNIRHENKVYIAGSKTESRFMYDSLKGMYDCLRKGGLSDYNLRVVVRDRGRHNERFWGLEFKKMYLWLFGKQ
jgi:predicted alpha/beta superfamily hydrolase